MQFLSSWTTSDLSPLLHFSDLVLEIFERHMQRVDSDFEAGGLLLGTIHGSNIFVTEATTPTAWDKRFRFFFERMSFGHRSIALLRWRGSRGVIRYVGEWHTHPEDHPKPSGIDRDEWNKLAKQRKDNRPALAVIVGRKTLYVELVPTMGEGLIMHSFE
ncbi:MAG: Mov34/MPN/PAD-1 family protein [Methylotenera sp.]